MSIHWLKKIDAAAEKVATSFVWRQFFFAFATLIAIRIMGYHFGTFDQASHIPFLKKIADPSLFPHDRFFELQQTHYS